MTADQSLLEESILLALLLERLARKASDDIAVMLNDLRHDLLTLIVRLDPTSLTYEANRRSRLEELIKAAEKAVSDAYVRIANRSDRDLFDVAELTQDSSNALLAALLAIKGLSRRLDADALRDLRDEVIIEGATVREWWARQSGDMQFRVRRALEESMRIHELGEQPVLEDLVTPVRSNEPGTLFLPAVRNAEGLTFTAFHAVASLVRLETIIRHPEFFKYIKHLSIIDQKTSDVCRIRNNRLWDMDGNPVGHGLPFRRTPLHFRCRSHLVPVLRAYGDLPPRIQRRVREEDFDGRPATEPNLADWLSARGMSRDDEPMDFDEARKRLGL